MADVERMRSRTVMTATGCWEWKGQVSARTGYGQVWHAGTNRLAHRVMYELAVGPIPEGMHIDHLCRVRHCVNPAHMEPVTSRTNTLRGVGLSAENAVKTECKHGHAFTPANTYVDPLGKRQCRACRASRRRTPEARAKKRAWWASRQGVSA